MAVIRTCSCSLHVDGLPHAPLGDHLTIPAYSETGEVYALDISFHKGMTYETCVRFPQAPQPVKDALYELLEKTETR